MRRVGMRGLLEVRAAAAAVFGETRLRFQRLSALRLATLERLRSLFFTRNRDGDVASAPCVYKPRE